MKTKIGVSFVLAFALVVGVIVTILALTLSAGSPVLVKAVPPSGESIIVKMLPASDGIGHGGGLSASAMYTPFDNTGEATLAGIELGQVTFTNTIGTIDHGTAAEIVLTVPVSDFDVGLGSGQIISEASTGTIPMVTNISAASLASATIPPTILSISG